jgi:aminoglycoside 6'-N-acetyltransferase I
MCDTAYDQPILAIRPINLADARAWLRMRCELWPDGSADHPAEIESFFAGTLMEPLQVLVAETGAGCFVGFAELSIRTDLPALEGERVGYVEGLYVVPEARSRGSARALLRMSRAWALQQQCKHFASDRAGRIIVDHQYRLERDGAGAE